MTIATILAVLAVMMCITPAYAEDALCPDVDTEKTRTPSDVAGVQADIERLSLCVERAKLLKQLDEEVKKRDAILNKDSNAAFGGGMGMPPLPVSALPKVSGVNTPSMDTSNLRAGIAPFQAAVATPDSWKVRKIWGQGRGMNAQLTNGQGVLLNVLHGDPLPDGSTVDSISAKGVSISQKGKTKELSWDDATAEPLARGGRNVSSSTP